MLLVYKKAIELAAALVRTTRKTRAVAATTVSLQLSPAKRSNTKDYHDDDNDMDNL